MATDEAVTRQLLLNLNSNLQDRLQELPIGSHRESVLIADVLLEVLRLQCAMFAELSRKTGDAT